MSQIDKEALANSLAHAIAESIKESQNNQISDFVNFMRTSFVVVMGILLLIGVCYGVCSCMVIGLDKLQKYIERKYPQILRPAVEPIPEMVV